MGLAPCVDRKVMLPGLWSQKESPYVLELNDGSESGTKSR